MAGEVSLSAIAICLITLCLKSSVLALIFLEVMPYLRERKAATCSLRWLKARRRLRWGVSFVLSSQQPRVGWGGWEFGVEGGSSLHSDPHLLGILYHLNTSNEIFWSVTLSGGKEKSVSFSLDLCNQWDFPDAMALLSRIVLMSWVIFIYKSMNKLVQKDRIAWFDSSQYRNLLHTYSSLSDFK